MRIGRVVTAGTMAMGAYRAYRRYKGAGATTTGRGTKQRQGAGIGALLKRR